ncbi:MAG TPA: hypothetical protein DD745_01660 [Bacteroidales bacterium]|nr:hypothetical protein [Bacteroidales bacterium]HCU19581.1 hypothetical protein [Bacteroidales bacterium]
MASIKPGLLWKSTGRTKSELAVFNFHLVFNIAELIPEELFTIICEKKHIYNIELNFFYSVLM